MRQKIKDRQLEPFDVMKAELKALNSKGIKPVIVIDELQALDFIYFNGQRELTKERHLCHVLLSSSDRYFLEKLYNDSKLKKTSELFEVDYLPREDIVLGTCRHEGHMAIDFHKNGRQSLPVCIPTQSMGTRKPTGIRINISKP